MNTYTFTAEQLRFILADAITEYAGEGYMHFSEHARAERDAAIERIMANQIPIHIDTESIPFDGRPIPPDDDNDNVSPAALGLPLVA